MFGYVRIGKKGLDEEDFAVFKAYYCGLCKAIGRYSQIARLGLTYDMTFLSVLLSSVCNERETKTTFRCLLHPLKKEAAYSGKIVDYAAKMSILLAYKKFEDDLKDEKSAAAFFGKMLYSNPMKRIKHTDTAEKISALLAKLSELEAQGCTEPDEAADCFAEICKILFTPDFVTEENTRRILEWMGYNIGRWIYLIDAFDDLEKDMKKHAYNPFSSRRGKEGFLEDTEATLTANLANIAAAYDLLPPGKNDKIIKNIIYSGMGGIQNKVLNLREEDDESV